MTFNEYSSFMNDKLHLFEVAGKRTITPEQKKAIFAQAFGEDKVDEAMQEYDDYLKKKKELKQKPGVRDFLNSKKVKNAQELINKVIGEQSQGQSENPNAEGQQLTEEQKQLKDKYDAAKKAYDDKVDIIKKGIDIDTIGTRIDTLADGATKLNMPAEKVQKIKNNTGEFKRTAGMVLEGIGAILSVFPGLEGLAQIAGGLGAVATKYGNKEAEEAAKEAENYDKNKQVLSQAGISSKEEYETALNNIIAQKLNSLPKYLERAVKNNPTLEQETAQKDLITEQNNKTTNYYNGNTLADVSPDNIAEADLNNIMMQLGITEQNQQNTYKRNLKWREDPNYDGEPKYKIDLSAKKYLSNLINAKDFNTINKLKGDNSTGDNNGNQ